MTGTLRGSRRIILRLFEQGVRVEYRRRRRRLASDYWHSSRECENDPKTEYDTRTSMPVTGDVCPECKKKERQGATKDRTVS
jgi:hypothetical protein